MEAAHNILLLDSDEQSAHDIQRFLKVSAYAFSVSHASDIHEGLNYLKNRKPDIVLLDAQLVKEKDFASFKQLAAKENIPVILLSDSTGGESKKQAELAGADDYMIKNKINLFHLQKLILNAVKISETEAKLDVSLNQFVHQQESLYKLLDKTESGIIVINAEDAILYANTKAYSILGEESIRGQLAAYLVYHKNLDEEESIELKSKNKTAISIRLSALEWNGEKANLFVLDRLKTKDEGNTEFLPDEKLLGFLNSVSGGIILLKGAQIIFANKHALKNVKLKQNEIVAKNLKDIFEGNEILGTKPSVRSFFEEKESEGIMKTADGSMQRVRMLLKPINIGDEFYQLFSFDLIKAEPDINAPKARSDEAQFSTGNVLQLASHDLREPVRTILNYVQLISENLQNQKYEAATEYAGFAKAAADRMEKLLSDLKVYIALNDYNFSLGKVSMKLAATDVIKQLKHKIEEAGADVNVAELPEVTADRDLVEKLLYQLIDNALKFQKKGKKIVIDIGFDKYEGNILFCVRDNGLGISKRYQEKIFELFERLNRVDEYPGNGLGLAVCKKIVEMHGGKIWVESLPGFGSNFYFMLSSR